MDRNTERSLIETNKYLDWRNTRCWLPLRKQREDWVVGGQLEEGPSSTPSLKIPVCQEPLGSKGATSVSFGLQEISEGQWVIEKWERGWSSREVKWGPLSVRQQKLLQVELWEWMPSPAHPPFPSSLCSRIKSWEMGWGGGESIWPGSRRIPALWLSDNRTS